jgi:uncharacterized membrane protein (DUF485 family)
MQFMFYISYLLIIMYVKAWTAERKQTSNNVFFGVVSSQLKILHNLIFL